LLQYICQNIMHIFMGRERIPAGFNDPYIFNLGSSLIQSGGGPKRRPSRTGCEHISKDTCMVWWYHLSLPYLYRSGQNFGPVTTNCLECTWSVYSTPWRFSSDFRKHTPGGTIVMPSNEYVHMMQLSLS